ERAGCPFGTAGARDRSRANPRRPGRGRRARPAGSAAERAGSAGRQQAAGGADRARHLHRRGGGDRHCVGGRGGAAAGAGPDPVARRQPAGHLARQRQPSRRPARRRAAAQPHLGRRAGLAGGARHRRGIRQHPRAESGGGGQRQLVHQRAGLRPGPVRGAGLGAGGRALLHRRGGARRAQGGGAGRHGGRGAVRRRGRGRAGDPRPFHALRGDRGAGAQGPEPDGAGPGRRRGDPVLDGAAERDGRQPRVGARRQLDQPQGRGRGGHGGGRGRGALPHAPAPPPGGERAGRLQPPQHVGRGRDLRRFGEDAVHAVGLGGGGVAAGGRHRCHEHHAGERHGAHARDRAALGHRCAAARHLGAVPDRGGGAGAAGRRGRRGGGHRPVARAGAGGGLAGADPDGRGGAGGGRQRVDRAVLRLLAGAARGAARPHRGAAARL
ncbi:MAG: ABC-type antimicrobial peptide transport system, permease component, partial [uncultured Acetobacteraceae bacterium]